MSNRSTINKYLAGTFFCLLFPIVCLCQIAHEKVVRVSDGKTITVLESTNTQAWVKLHGISFPESGQEKIWTKQAHVNEAVEYELKNNSRVRFINQSVSMSEDYYPYLDMYTLENPIIVEHDSVRYLPFYSSYFFSAKDSIIRVVLYDWEIDMYSDKSLVDLEKQWKEENEKFNQYNKEYERIKENLITEFGSPSIQDSTPRRVKSEWDSNESLTRKTVWDSDKSYAHLELIFAENTHRIRLIHYWKEK